MGRSAEESDHADVKILEDVARDLLELSGDNPDREGLVETPKRFAKAFGFWTSGYRENVEKILRSFEDGGEDYDQMIVETKIPVWSLCEHHLAPFFGFATVAYIPDGKILGLSKIPRLIEVFARRLQVQERLTSEIADALDVGLSPRGVAVSLRCRHSCMESRGVQRAGIETTTTQLIGVFRTEAAVRAEFFAVANGH